MAAPPQIFDRFVVAQHRAQKRDNCGKLWQVAINNRTQLIDRLNDISMKFSSALICNSLNLDTARILEKEHKIKNIYFSDLSESRTKAALKQGYMAVNYDEEWVPFAQNSFDLIIVEQSLHWTNDLPGALIQLKNCLKPDGLFLASLYGGSSLIELRQALIEAETNAHGGATPRISPFIDVRDAGNLALRAGFSLPVADTQIVQIEYANLRELFTDLKQMGESNAIKNRYKGLTTPRLFKNAEELYLTHSSSNNKITATFEIITITGWAPSENQQKPLKPGSALQTIAEALNTKEHNI
jgi:NADH dehydrogenase [ubiquinone] 1 alpha subcomplex assembly factor 5